MPASSRDAHAPAKRSDQRTLLLVGLLMGGMLVLSVLMSYQYFTRPYPGFNDFATPWAAARSFFYQGIDPYSAQASLNIQTLLYGGPATADQQPNHYAYPFYTLFVAWPLIHLDYAWATAIWLVVNEALLIGALFLLLSAYRWRPPKSVLVGLILLSLFSYPAARGLLLGQVSHLVYFLLAVMIWAITRSRDRLAGFVLALATLKPQLAVFVAVFVLLWALAERRWTLIAWFAVPLAALLGLSFLLLPGWVSGFIDQLLLYPSYIEVSTPAQVAAGLFGPGAQAVELALNALGLVVLVVAWWQLLVNKRRERFGWTLMLTLTMSQLIGLRTATPHFVVLMIPLIGLLALLDRRRHGRWSLLVMLALFVLPWVQFLATLEAGKQEHPWMFVPLPLTMLILLLVTRRAWWRAGFVSPPADDKAGVLAHD